MRYIRRKDNHKVILASGYVDPGGLGVFDPAIYEEIEGDLPKGAAYETPLTTEQRFRAIVTAITGLPQRRDCYLAWLAHQMGDKSTAASVIQTLVGVSPTIKDQLLEVLS